MDQPLPMEGAVRMDPASPPQPSAQGIISQASTSGLEHSRQDSPEESTSQTGPESSPITHRTVAATEELAATSLPSTRPKTRSTLPETGIPVGSLSRKEERLLFTAMKKVQVQADRKTKAKVHKLQRTWEQDVLKKARMAKDAKRYDEAFSLLNEVMASLRDKPDNTVIANVFREMAHISGRSGDSVSALMYWEMHQKFNTRVNQGDVFFFSALYLGTPLFSYWTKATTRTFPGFSPEKAYLNLMKNLPAGKGLDAIWKQFCLDQPDFQPLVEGLSMIRNQKTWDISQPLKALRENPEMSFYADLLLSASIQQLISQKKYDQALASTNNFNKNINNLLRPYYTALLNYRLGQYNEAYDIFFEQLENEEPVFKEFSEMMIELEDLETAATIFLCAEEYYFDHGYPQEATYFQLQAGILIEQMKKEADVLERQLAKEKAGLSNPSPLSDEETPPEMPSHSRQEALEPLTEVIPKKTESRRKKTVQPTQPMVSKEIKSATRNFHSINDMIRKFKFGAYDPVNEYDIETEISKALKAYPDDIWILHSAGWWHFEQGNYESAKAHLLRGLQISLGRHPKWKTPSSAQSENQLLWVVDKLVNDFLEANKGIESEYIISQRRHIASFLSAYAHIQASEGLYENARKFRQLADLLDSRRVTKAQRKQFFTEQKVKLVSTREFETQRTALKKQ